MAKINIRQWVENFKNGAYDSPSRKVQIDAGWFDWFCDSKSLAGKTKFLGNKLMSILGSKKFDIDNDYVWFKNNCPVVGPLYDDFRIADIAEGHVRYSISHLNKGSHGCLKAHWEVWGRENAFKEPLIEGDWRTIKKFFLDE